MEITAERLKSEMAGLEKQKLDALATLTAIDGAMQFCRNMIALAEEPAIQAEPSKQSGMQSEVIEFPSPSEKDAPRLP